MNYWAGIWSIFSNHSGHASATIGNNYYYLDINDRILKKNESIYTDAGVPVLMKFRTPWYQVGAVAGFQRLYNAVIQGKIEGDHGFLVNIYYDFEDNHRETLRFTTGTIPTFGVTPPDIHEVFSGNMARAAEHIRVQPRYQKCTAISIEVVEYLPRGMIPSGALKLFGVRLEIGQKQGSYRWDEAKSARSLLSGV
jgi:hypothetical protein